MLTNIKYKKAMVNLSYFCFETINVAWFLYFEDWWSNQKPNFQIWFVQFQNLFGSLCLCVPLHESVDFPFLSLFFNSSSSYFNRKLLWLSKRLKQITVYTIKIDKKFIESYFIRNSSIKEFNFASIKQVRRYWYR